MTSQCQIYFFDFLFSKKLFTLFYFGAALHSMWDLSSPAKDGTHTPCNGGAES